MTTNRCKSQSSIAATAGCGLRGEIFSDDIVAAAMIDRLVYHAEVIAPAGDSYRTQSRRELLAGAPPGSHS